VPPDDPTPPAVDPSGLHAVFQPEPTTPARGRLLLHGGGDTAAAARRLGFADGTADEVALVEPVDGAAAVRRRQVLAFGIGPAWRALERLPLREEVPWRPRVSDSLRTWALAQRLARRLLNAHRLVPTLVSAGDGPLHGVWRAAPHGDPQLAAAIASLAAAMPPAAHALPEGDAGMWRAEMLLDAFLDAAVDHAARHGGPAPDPGRPRARLLPWTARWAEALADPVDPTVPLRHEAGELLAGMPGWHGAGDPSALGTAEIHLVAPAADEDEDGWALTLGVRDEHGRFRPAAEVW
jgi:hypothetical protein